MSAEPAAEPTADPHNAKFIKVLGARQVIALAFGAMIGWSWVLLTGNWVLGAGSLGTLIAFAGGGFAIACIGLTYAELASAIPKAGGEHVYTARGLGAGASFVCSWALLLAYVAVCMFEAVALPTAMEYLLPQLRIGTLWEVLGAPVDLGFVLLGVAGTLGITWLNVLGIGVAARAQQVALVLILLAGVVLFVGALSNGNLDNAQPLIVSPATGILSVLIMVPAMLVGFDVIPQSAEEINLPPQDIGRLLMASVCLAVLWYAGISLAVASAMPSAELAKAGMASADAASVLWQQPWMGKLVVIGGAAGILTSWNAFVIGGSRVMYALAQSGQLPAAFGRLHSRYGTPYISILAIGLLSALAPLFGRTVLVWLVDASSFAVVVAYLFVPIAFLAIRRKEPDLPRPFRIRYPRLVGYGSIVLALGLLSAFLPWSPSALLWPQEWLLILVWAILGVVVYFGYRPVAGTTDSNKPLK